MNARLKKSIKIWLSVMAVVVGLAMVLIGGVNMVSGIHDKQLLVTLVLLVGVVIAVILDPRDMITISR